MSTRPCVTRMDRRTHARRRGLWERGVALRGCALFLSFSFFPPSRPSSAPVLQPSPPLMYRLQVFGLSYSYCDNSSHLRHCFALLFLIWLGPFLCWLYCAYSFKTCLPSPIATPHYACRHFGPMLLQEKLFWSSKRSLGSLLTIFCPRPLSMSVPKQLSSAPSSCRVLLKLSTVFVQIGVGLYLHNKKKDSPALEGQIFALSKLCSKVSTREN